MAEAATCAPNKLSQPAATTLWLQNPSHERVAILCLGRCGRQVTPERSAAGAGSGTGGSHPEECHTCIQLASHPNCAVSILTSLPHACKNKHCSFGAPKDCQNQCQRGGAPRHALKNKWPSGILQKNGLCTGPMLICCSLWRLDAHVCSTPPCTTREISTGLGGVPTGAAWLELRACC